MKFWSSSSSENCNLIFDVATPYVFDVYGWLVSGETTEDTVIEPIFLETLFAIILYFKFTSSEHGSEDISSFNIF